MNGQAQAPNPVIEAFGKGVGFVVALFTTMPVYHFTYDWFDRYALSFSHPEYRWLWELVYIAALFFAIVVAVWFVLSTALGIVKGFFQLLGLLFALFWR